MRLVITGSESFVGRELIAHCRARGVGLIGADSVAATDKDCRQADIRSPDIAAIIPEGADAVVHLAAISTDKDCRRDPASAFDVNVGGTLNLMQAAEKRKVKQFIFASSEWVYGNCAADQVQTEDTPIDANNIVSEYALTKIAGERLLAMACQRGFCPVTVLRFGIIYGPRPKPMSAVEGLLREVSTLDTVEMNCSLKSGRRFIHVSDIADGILAAVGRAGFEVFNLSGDSFITFGEIVRESARLTGRNPRVVEKNAHVLNVRNADNARARRMLNWAPKLDLAAGLATLMR
jgi:UDP-glucose 4-epimerase